MEAGKKRLSGDFKREANSSEVADLRQQNRDLKQLLAEQALDLWMAKKNLTGLE